MLPDRPLPHHGFPVAPGSVRQDPARRPNALEAFVVYETVYLFEDWRQAFREAELEIELFLLGMDFEDHREHRRCLRMPELVPYERQLRFAVGGSRPAPQPCLSILSVDRLMPVVF
jgi:hypothetical protein